MRNEHNHTHASQLPISIPNHTWPAFQALLRAHELSTDACCDRWSFAVEIQTIIQIVDRTDLRWLVKKGFFAHALEMTKAGDPERGFLENASLKFSKRSCFVLTEDGLTVARSLEQQAAEAQFPAPKWDGSRHELTVGDRLVKKFKLPSRNQETILAAFQEEGWPARIDDPLPPHPDIDPKRRLHDTIKGLNRNQKNRVIRFLGDGTGEAVTWELSDQTAESDRHSPV